MKQADLGLNLTTKRTRKREFLDEMNRVVPWAALETLIAPYAPEGKKGRAFCTDGESSLPHSAISASISGSRPTALTSA